ncbi:acetyl-CoA acetyltransferase [Plasmodium brasilianum]|uniref:Acetyl-CoA acetyltransferase, putative n=2 Tax=Plasmodium (Plasmodium) TaxID=418103 RepID=A0A1D3SQ72_PLAMA|nr:acetyl-CoA acetyltransferase, putative [Plasmodium malariae]KAI4836771.1 acetyl-CoA acetyltransferase [Plasmodium brasilianum]SCO94064.1 acetyl-CoA acetyltransferase, putative [Plasmodium malariae]
MIENSLRKVYVVGYARTPIGALCGSISQIPVHKLAIPTILKALERSQIEKNVVDCLVFGQSFSGGCGPLPLQKILVATGINIDAKTHLVSNLCCSGLDSITVGYEFIKGGKDVCVVGSMESMSQSPFFLKNLRTAKYNLGNNILYDTNLSDGYDYITNSKELKKDNMFELFCKKFKIPRVDLDEYVINSFKRTANAYSDNLIQQEIFPLIIQKKKNKLELEKTIIDSDEIYKKCSIDNICNLSSDSIVTNYNIAPFADGACAIILMSEKKINELELNPLAEIITYDNASVYPSDFPLSISHSITKCLKKINKSFVDYYEINESSALDVIFNMNNLNLDLSNVNLNGGSLSLGHPSAVSGSRIFISLITVLKNFDMKLGCASINNYLGSSTSIVLENV